MTEIEKAKKDYRRGKKNRNHVDYMHDLIEARARHSYNRANTKSAMKRSPDRDREHAVQWVMLAKNERKCLRHGTLIP